MTELSISLLGPPAVTLNGQSLLPFSTAKVLALLSILVTEEALVPGVAVQREKLMGLIWPWMPDVSARKNLRQTIYLLRQVIPRVKGPAGDVPFVLGDYHRVQINPQACYEFDLASFITLTATGESQALDEAVKLYRGDFLQDFYVEGSNEFEDWAAYRRTAIRRQMVDTLEALAFHHLAEGDYEKAGSYARQQIALEPLYEKGQRLLIEALARSGQPGAALAAYEAFRHQLRQELEVIPSEETQQLMLQIRTGRLQTNAAVHSRARGYELQEQIGQGSFGIVYQAIQATVGREVAVKIIRQRFADDADFIRRFEAEAQLIARLEHPYIVPLYDYWRQPGEAYLVMRWMRGGNLKETLEQGPLPVERVTNLVDQIAPALHRAHEQGILHRDLKPANILLDEDGNAYLADFGIAIELGSSRTASFSSLEYVSPEQIRDEPLRPQTDIYSLGLVLYEMLCGEKPFSHASLPGLLKKHLEVPLPLLSQRFPQLPPQVDAVIQRATAKDPADRYPDALLLAADFRRAVRKEKLEAELSSSTPALAGINPYKGLRPFREEDAEFFFGRQALIEKLLSRLSTGRFLAVLGPSGSGKSSVVSAGLIPALRAGALRGSEKWFIAHMAPGTYPLEALEMALLNIAVNPPPSLVETMQKDERGLLHILPRILPGGPDAQLLLVVDQFEELYTLTVDDRQRYRFIDGLLAAIADPGSALRVVVTLRADFYDRPLTYLPLGELLQGNTEVVLPLTRDELEQVVRKPGERVGVGLEHGLMSFIAADVSNQPGALPLLQYTLTELYEARQDHTMTCSAYQALGCIAGALGRRAEDLYELLDEREKDTAHQVFLRLVTLGEGVEDTRRRILRSELVSLAQARVSKDSQEGGSLITSRDRLDDINQVLDLFGHHRLITFDHDPLTRGATVEIAHEALLTAWPRFKDWIEMNRDDLRQQQRLSHWAREWEESGRESGLLLRGARLDQMAGWAAQTDLTLSYSEGAFLEASLAARREREAEEEARRQRELEMAQKLAVEKAIAFSRELAMAALVNMDSDPELSIMLALHALDVARTREAENVLHQALAASRVKRTLFGHIDEVTALAFSPDGARLATGSSDKTARIWDIASGQSLHTLVGYDHLIGGLAFSPNGNRLAASSYDGTIRIWDVLTGEQQTVLTLEGTEVEEVEFSPDGRLLAASAYNQTIVYDTMTWQPQLVFPEGRENVAFSPNGRLLVFNSAKNDPFFMGDVVVWDLEAGRELATLHNSREVSGLSFSPDSRLLATEGNHPGAVKVWHMDLDSPQKFGQEMARRDGARAGSPASTINFLPDNRRVLFLGVDGQIKVWDVEKQVELESFAGSPAPNAVVVNPAGTLVASSNIDGTVKLCRLETTCEWQTIQYNDQKRFSNVIFNHEGTVLYTAYRGGKVSGWDATVPGTLHDGLETFLIESLDNYYIDVKLNPEGDLLAAAAFDGNAYLWKSGTGEQVAAFVGHEEPIWRVAISPDGTRLATASMDKTARVWDLSTGEEIYKLTGFADQVTDVAFSPDGQLLVTASLDGTLKGWEAEAGAELFRFEFGSGVWAVAFSPDGHYLACAGNDSIVHLWDMSEFGDAGFPKEIRRMRGHLTLIAGLAFSPDGKRIASASWDHTARVWDVASGEEILTLKAHTDNLTGVAFSPDGKRLATTSWDGTVRIFLLELDELVALARDRLTRWFTQDECSVYLHTENCPPPTSNP